jgi:hypothetical protein
MLTRSDRARQGEAARRAAVAAANKGAPILRWLEGELLRLVSGLLSDGDLTCFRLVCKAFLANSEPPERRSLSAFMRSAALVKFAWEELHGFREGCPNHLLLAAGVGNVAAVEWLRVAGCGWSQRVPARAAANGHLAVVRWAREHGCPWDERTCYSAAGGGHLEVLRWAREHGCSWNEGTCSSAAGGGHLEVLRWPREHGCPCPAYLATV